MKLLGVICVVMATALLGLEKGARLRQRVSTLSAVISVLRLLRGEILERRSPMPELLPRLRRDAPPVCRQWLRRLETEAGDLSGGFARVWSRAIRASEELALRPGEVESLALLGLVLGRFDAPEQAAAIDRCIRELECCRAAAEEEARVQGRLFAGLGLTAGLMLSVLLL